MKILWGKDKDLDYWTALQQSVVPAPEKRAMSLLASLSDERRFSFYCASGMFPAMGDVTKRIYMVRRWTTVLELEDGRPRASWCILTKDREVAPETDHVVAMKNILEGSELAFREVGNAFHYAFDPFRGNVDIEIPFANPYVGAIGPRNAPAPSDGQLVHENAALEFAQLANWKRAARMKAEALRDIRLEAAKKWVQIPDKQKRLLPRTSHENAMDRIQQGVVRIGGLFGVQQTCVAAGTASAIQINSNSATFPTFHITTP